MKISNIDRDFVKIIEYLNNNGYKPFASCDGVASHHKENNTFCCAYIVFLKSPQILELMSAFFRDKENFEVRIRNNSSISPYKYCGNEIKGNTYAVYFKNEKGEKTSYFEKIIKRVTEEKIMEKTEEYRNLNRINKILEDNDSFDLNLGIALNSYYQPYMDKKGKISFLSIQTKNNCGYCKNMNVLANLLSDKFNIIKKSEFDEKIDEEEFSVCYRDNLYECYFNNENIEKIFNIINCIKKIEKELPKCKNGEHEL